MEAVSNTSKFFDFIDNVDRYFYGRKAKNFILGSVFVLIIAPLLDEILEVPHDRLTHLVTFVFMLYVLLLTLAWVSAWRDDHGKWTLACASARLKTYWEVLRETANETRTNSKDETLYKTGWFLFFFALGWKACQNLSVFVRKPAEHLFHSHFAKLRGFESFTKHWYWLLMLIGVGIMFYLYRTNKNILERIKKDLFQLFSNKKHLSGGYNNELIKIDAEKLIINNKSEDHIQEITTTDRSGLFQDFVMAMKSWNPGKLHYEYEFQNKLYKHLKKHMKNSSIEMEYPIGDAEHGNKGRGDIVIDDTILIEMKRDSSAGAVQRAKGQILQYSDIWRNKGPVILLLCNYEYEHAKLSFSSTMSDLNRLERPVLTIVAQN